MNELPEDVPALSAEASEFLKRHANTGEPSARALQRVKEALPTPRARLLRFARVAVPVAAALAIVVFGAWGWLQRARPAEPVTEAPPPARSEPAIPVMTLVDDATPLPAPPPDPKLVELREVYLRAYMLKDSDPAKARQLFERIVAEGDPRSETYLKAKSRLSEVPRTLRRDAGSFEALEDLYQRAYVIRERSPAEAVKLFQRIVDATEPDSVLHQKAKAQLAALAE